MKQFTAEDLPKILQKMNLKIHKIEKLIKAGNREFKRENDDLLTIEKASELLNLSVSTIYTKVSKNEIPVNKQGKRLYFCRTELLDWIKSGRIKTVDEIHKETENKFSKTKHFK